MCGLRTFKQWWNRMLRYPYNKNSGLRIAPYREQEETLVEDTLLGGLSTIGDAADIENNQFRVAKNVVFRDGKCSVRPGNAIIYAPVANALDVVTLKLHYTVALGRLTLRFTPTTIHRIGTGAWTAINGGAILGTRQNRSNTVTAADRFFFTSQLALQEINFTTNTYATLGNSPATKFIANFNNRLVAAYEYTGAGGGEDKLMWSGNLNYAEWNAAVDPSAGFVKLLSNSGGTSDPIAGLFVIGERLYILRENSIWIADIQPSATSPFRFTEYKTNIAGCDSPFTAIATLNGFAWFDRRSNTAYLFKPQEMADPVPISNDIRDFIKAEIGFAGYLNPTQELYASYNTAEDEYSLVIPRYTAVAYTREVIYNLRNKTWTSHLRDQPISAIVSGIYPLTGGGSIQGRLSGHLDGSITSESATKNSDAVPLANEPFQVELRSKVWKMPRNGMYIKTIRFDYISRGGFLGSINFSYSKNGKDFTGGVGFIGYPAGTDDNRRKSKVFHINVRADLFQWELISAEGLYDLLGFEVVITGAQADTRTR